jgi:hypothetical protein
MYVVVTCDISGACIVTAKIAERERRFAIAGAKQITDATVCVGRSASMHLSQLAGLKLCRRLASALVLFSSVSIIVWLIVLFVRATSNSKSKAHKHVIAKHV